MGMLGGEGPCVDDRHRPLEAMPNEILQGYNGALDHSISLGELLGCKGREDIVSHLAPREIASNSAPQAGNVLRSQSLDDGGHTIVPTVAPGSSEADGPEWEVELVEHDHNALRRDVRPSLSAVDSLSTAVHEGQREDCPHGVAVDLQGSLQPRAWTVMPLSAVPLSECLDDHPPNVVPRLCVFRARIAQTDDEPLGCRYAHGEFCFDCWTQ